MEADDLLCSRNARPQKGLVGRAQWKINQPPSLKREWMSVESDGKGSLAVLLLEERALSEGPRSTRAFEDRPGYSRRK